MPYVTGKFIGTDVQAGDTVRFLADNKDSPDDPLDFTGTVYQDGNGVWRYSANVTGSRYYRLACFMNKDSKYRWLNHPTSHRVYVGNVSKYLDVTEDTTCPPVRQDPIAPTLPAVPASIETVYEADPRSAEGMALLLRTICEAQRDGQLVTFETGVVGEERGMVLIITTPDQQAGA